MAQRDVYKRQGTFSPLPHIEEVNDLDDPEFTYPVITGKYVLGENVHPWKSEPIVVGAVSYTHLVCFSISLIIHSTGRQPCQ